MRQLINRHLSHAIRSAASVNTEYGAGQLTSHAAMTDPDDLATPTSDIANAVQPPPAHLIAQLSSVHGRHMSAQTSRHSRSSIGRPLQPP